MSFVLSVLVLSIAQVSSTIVTFILSAFFVSVIGIVAYNHGKKFAVLTALLLLGAILSWLAEWDDSEPDNWWHAFNMYSLILFISAAVSLAIPALLPNQRGNGSASARVLVFKLMASLLLVCLFIFLYRLSSILKDNKSLTLYESTIQECDALSNPYLNITLFDSTLNTHCASTIWDLIRFNVLFLVQLYAMYLLTTEIKRFATSLIILEALLWSMASITQFNSLESCYKLRTYTLVLIVTVAVVHTARVMSIAHENELTINAYALHVQPWSISKGGKLKL